MPHKLLPTIEFTRHARWLRRSTGSEHALAVCDAGGAPCWIAPGHEGLADWLAQLNAGGFAWPSSTCANTEVESAFVSILTLDG